MINDEGIPPQRPADAPGSAICCETGASREGLRQAAHAQATRRVAAPECRRTSHGRIMWDKLFSCTFGGISPSVRLTLLIRQERQGLLRRRRSLVPHSTGAVDRRGERPFGIGDIETSPLSRTSAKVPVRPAVGCLVGYGRYHAMSNRAPRQSPWPPQRVRFAQRGRAQYGLGHAAPAAPS